MKYTKRLTSLIVLIASLLLCACGKTSTSNKALYNHGMDIIALMTEMADNEQYISIFTGNTDIAAIVKGINQGDFSTPKAVYALTVPDAQIDTLAEIESMGNLSPELKKMLRDRSLAALITQINGFAGANALATASLCSAAKPLVGTTIDNYTVYIYTFENATPIAVIFTPGEDNITGATGQFILHDKFTCNSAEELESLFADWNIEVKVETVK
ncbi:MAG: hypothetical protein IJ335_06940 [Lachnospiraceae bacterium]|nr:hypothetical protein [Lachnospiraceae bacterium]